MWQILEKLTKNLLIMSYLSVRKMDKDAGNVHSSTWDLVICSFARGCRSSTSYKGCGRVLYYKTIKKDTNSKAVIVLSIA